MSRCLAVIKLIDPNGKQQPTRVSVVMPSPFDESQTTAAEALSKAIAKYHHIFGLKAEHFKRRARYQVTDAAKSRHQIAYDFIEVHDLVSDLVDGEPQPHVSDDFERSWHCVKIA
jgi:hypothetical protein